MSRNNFIYLHNAVLGYAIMSLEMVANRYLSPFFGGSNLIWANIIGSVMLFLALGYYFGGKLADKYPLTRVYFGMSFIAGIVTFILPIVLRIILNNPYIIGGNQYQIILSLIVSSIAFGIPIGFMALVNPFNLKLLQLNQITEASTNQNSNLGRQSGLLSVWGTVGSLLGTYLTTFLTTPYLGVNTTIILCSGLILFSSLCGLIIFKDLKLSKIQSAITIVILLTCLVGNNYTLQVFAFKSSNIIHEQETLYQKISVFQDNQNSKYLIFDAPNNVQSKYNSSEKILDNYVDNYVVLTDTKTLAQKSKLNILIIGYAGGGVGKNLHNFKNPNVEINIDGVELDEQVTKVSKEYFEVKDWERNIFHTDGRKFVQSTKNKYDIVILDAFQNLFVPVHLLTVEFFKEVKQILNPDGIIGMNIVGLNPDSGLLQRVNNTVATSFKNVEYYDTKKGNYTILASNQVIEFEQNNLQSDYPKNLYNDFVTNLKSYSTSPDSNSNSFNPFTDDKSDLHNLLNYDYLSAKTRLN